ncbi:hypothetical protein YC2023_093866 [Brassica napus]
MCEIAMVQNIQERDERPQKSTSRRNGRRKSSKKTISASPTRSQIVVTNANVALTDPSEVAFNVCCLCVYCPLCILWCCIKLPFFCFAKNVNFIKDKRFFYREMNLNKTYPDKKESEKTGYQSTKRRITPRTDSWRD